MGLALGLGLATTRSAPAGGGGGLYACGAVTFDGSTFLANAALASSDSGFVSCSYWILRPLDTPDQVVWVVDPASQYLSNAYISAGGQLTFDLFANGQTSEFKTRGPNGSIPNNSTWHHVLFSAQSNLGAGAKIGKLYVDGVDVSPTLTDGDASFTAKFNGLPFRVSGDGSTNIIGDVADLWIAPGQSLLTAGDIAPETLAKFIAGGKPVDLGADGSTPTGTAPAMFFHRASAGAAATFGTNLGTGGAFTTTGTLTNASTSPSD